MFPVAGRPRDVGRACVQGYEFKVWGIAGKIIWDMESRIGVGVKCSSYQTLGFDSCFRA